MTWMVVVETVSVEVDPSKQLTTVPFRSLLTGLTTTPDISDGLFGPESLEKVIVEELIISGGGIPLFPTDVIGDCTWVTFSGKTVISHLKNIPVVASACQFKLIAYLTN